MRLTALAMATALSLPASAQAGEVLLRGLTLHLVEPAATVQNAEILLDDRGVVRCLSGDVTGARPPSVQAKPCREQAGSTAEVRDFGGKGVAIPNLIEPYNQLGLVEIEAEEESADGSTHRLANAAQVRAIDGIRLNSRAIQAAQQAGVGIAAVHPLGSSLITGQSAALRTCGATVDQAIIRSPVAVHARIGHAAKRDDQVTGSRSGQLAKLRELLLQGQRLAKAASSKQKLSPAQDDSLQRLRDDPSLPPLAEVMAGKLPLVVHADHADDIAAVLRLQRELGFRLQIAGGAEAHLAAAALAAQQVPVILTPGSARPNDFARLRATDQNARLLLQAGATVAIATEHTYDARNLRWELGLLVQQGVAWAAALRIGTLTAAQLLGLDPQVVAIAPGLPANFTVFDGDPLTYDGHAVWTSCGGTVWPQPRQR
ncbi:MAG: amidohydrolase family protein [Deltaproteobacteria bacterium]|nr:amidohydrolase family protein [Deltaproteobacteria bacterium]